MNTKDSNKTKVQNDGKQNSKVGNVVTDKYSSELQKCDSKGNQNKKKENGKEKIDNKTVLANLNNN